jgi:hypothetical protein
MHHWNAILKWRLDCLLLEKSIGERTGGRNRPSLRCTTNRQAQQSLPSRLVHGGSLSGRSLCVCYGVIQTTVLYGRFHSGVAVSSNPHDDASKRQTFIKMICTCSLPIKTEPNIERIYLNRFLFYELGLFVPFLMASTGKSQSENHNDSVFSIISRKYVTQQNPRRSVCSIPRKCFDDRGRTIDLIQPIWYQRGQINFWIRASSQRSSWNMWQKSC